MFFPIDVYLAEKLVALFLGPVREESLPSK